jgi:hypothetical protein
MTTSHEHLPPPPPQRRRSRALPATIGGVLASFGAVLAIAGGATLAVAGTDGTVASGHHELSTPTSALVSEPADISNTRDIASVVGQPRIKLSTAADNRHRDVFVGVGRTADVDRYLAGAATDKVTDLGVHPYKLKKDRQEGTAIPQAPTDQSFWVAQSSGRTAQLDWKVKDGGYRVVVMNADGAPGVATHGQLELGAPYLSTLALVGLLSGLAALAVGIALIAPSLNRPSSGTAYAPQPVSAGV